MIFNYITDTLDIPLAPFKGGVPGTFDIPLAPFKGGVPGTFDIPLTTFKGGGSFFLFAIDGICIWSRYRKIAKNNAPVKIWEFYSL